MSDSDDDDPFAAPGAITTRQDVQVSDVSSDDDDGGTFAALKSGAARKDALKEKQRLKAEKAQAQSASASGPPTQNVDDDDDDDVSIVDPPPGSAEPSSKRARRSPGKQAASSSSSEFDARTAALVAEEKRQIARKHDLLKSKSVFTLEDDDEEEEVQVTGARPARGGASSSAAASGGGGGGAARRVQLRVLADAAEPYTLFVPRDEPLGSGDFCAKVAGRLALDRERLSFWRTKPEDAPDGAAPLELTRTPAELGLAAPAGGTPATLWAVEAAVKTLRVKVRHGKAEVALDVPPATTFAELAAKFCAAHSGAAVSPAQVCLLNFDQDPMPPDETLAQNEVEDDDLFDVKLRT